MTSWMTTAGGWLCTAAVMLVTACSPGVEESTSGGGEPAPRECTIADPFELESCPITFPEWDCVVRVDGEAKGSGDGWSWPTAVRSVQEGIDIARCGTLLTGLCERWEVWVKRGTYFIERGCRTDVVRLRPRVSVYGGFAGSETSRYQRDWRGNETILDGRDGPEDNARVYHVVNGVDDATIDGFTICHGRADHPSDSFFASGGGIGWIKAAPTISNCWIRDNHAQRAGGGLLSNEGAATVSHCVFEANSAARGGGAALFGGSGTWVGNTFVDNEASDTGGALFASQDATAKYRQSHFSGNHADWGGAIWIEEGRADLDGTTFIGNSAAMRGGGLAVSGGASVTLSNSRFLRNSAEDGAGMFSQSDTTVRASNLVFFDNRAERWGAGIYNDDGDVQLKHLTFANNSAFDGGAIANIEGSLGLRNSILWGNVPNELAWFSNGDILVLHNIITGGHEGAGNLDADPRFVDAASAKLHLAPGSPCIDVADGDFTTPTDLLARDRVDDPETVDGPACAQPCADLGALEYQPPR